MDDAKYFGLVGEIITAEGDTSGISDDAFVFSSSSSNQLILLDYDHEASRKYLREKSERISNALAPFIGRNNITPDKMVNTFLNYSHTLMAVQRDECDLDRILMDTGSFLFSEDNGDYRRREEYTILDTSVMDYKKYGKITRIDTLLTTHTDIDSHRDRRRKIVADVVSFLSGLMCQTLYSTRGRVVYSPMGSCTYVATVTANHLELIVNDPLGEGWRLVPEGTVDYNNAGELMEFSTKLITDSLFSGRVKNHRKVNVLSSGTITMTGTGIVTTVNRIKDEIEQVLLTEGRVSIGYSSSNDIVTVSVGPTELSPEHFHDKFDSSKNIHSPSIFSWFNIKMNGIVPESTLKDDRYDDNLAFVRNEVCANQKRKKTCRIAERGDWSDQLLRLNRFVRGAAGIVEFMEGKMRNLSEVIGDSATRNILASSEPQCYAADAAYALTDFNTEEDDKNTLLPLLEYDRNVISLTIIGNAPTNGQTMRVVKLVKKMSGTTTALYTNECKWYNAAPTSIMTMDTINPVFVYTPRCVYHSKTAYVHLYSDNEGPLYDIKFSEEEDILTIEGENNNLADIKKPLAISAVAMTLQRNIGIVNEANRGERMIAKPIKLFASLDKSNGIVRFQTKEEEEFMNVQDLKWYQLISGGSEDMAGPPDCLLNQKLLNTVKIIKERSNAGEYVMRQEMNKYPSPFDSSLIRYGFVSEGTNDTKIILVVLIS